MLPRCLQTVFFVCLGACGTLIGATGCEGSEHVVLAPIFRSVDVPTGGMSGGTGGAIPDDGGISNPIDAGKPDSGEQDEEDSGLDPDVDFMWTETLPGQSGCSANHYAGSFICTLQDSPGGVVGQLTFDLVVNMGESMLTIENGRMSDLLTGAAFNADLLGSLSCVSYHLEATTENGQALSGLTTFESTLSGDLDPESLEIVGPLTITYDTGEVCHGAFQAGATP